MNILGMSRKAAVILVSGALGLGILGGGIAAAAASVTPAPEPETYGGGLPALYEAALQAEDLGSPTYEMLERAVSDGAVSSADYESAHLMYESCLLDQGIVPSFRKTGTGLYVELPYTNVKDVEALDQAVMGCSAKTGPVTTLYNVQVSNPEVILDQRVVAVECLADAGYVDPDYSPDRFETDLKADTLPFDTQEIGANDCLYGAGYAIFNLAKE